MRAQTVVSFAALVGATIIPSFASAHISLRAPQARAQAPAENVKNAPCGQNTDGRTSSVTVFQPGQVVTLNWVEYVNHPSYFRVAFQPDGDTFPMRKDVPQSNSVPETADQQQSAEEAVFAGSTAQLLAVVQDNNTSTTAMLTTQVTLPNVTCENCTLQIVQVMYNNPPQDGGGYYQCADIAIRGNGNTTTGDGNGTPGSTGEPPAGEPPAGEPDAGTGSQQNGNVSATAAPGAGMSNAGSGTKSVGSGANGDGPSAAQAGTTPAAATASAMSNSAETAMGVAMGSSASNPAAPAASAPPGGSALTPESSEGGGGGCSLGMTSSNGARVSVAFLAGLAWLVRRRGAR